MNFYNLDIRKEIAERGLRNWWVARELDVSEAVFSKLLSRPLTDREREKITAAIDRADQVRNGKEQ